MDALGAKTKYWKNYAFMFTEHSLIMLKDGIISRMHDVRPLYLIDGV